MAKSYRDMGHQRRYRAPSFACPCTQCRECSLEQVGDGAHPGDGTVSNLSCQLECPLAQSRDEDWSAWCAWQRRLDRVEATVVINLAFPQGRSQHRYILTQVLQWGCHGDAINSFDGWAMARPDPQSQSTGGKVAQCQRLLRQGQRMARIGGYDGSS